MAQILITCNNWKVEVNECMSTVLALTFSGSDDVPTEADFNKAFGYFGSLREAETEVIKFEKSFQFVFKRLSDAEVALRGAGKYNIFGTTLVSFKLKIELESKASRSSTIQRLQIRCIPC